MFGSKRKLGALDLRLGGFFSELAFGYDLAVELLGDLQGYYVSRWDRRQREVIPLAQAL
jgi:hypothetical protein